MDAGELDEAVLFRTLFGSGARVLVIGHQALHDRVLSAEEVARFRATPIAEEEIAGILELVERFTRRYQTARERFAYNRRAYARAVARQRIA